ncbi:hypothetical protein H4R34_003791 [Dimargaris verticillata]|uniref:Uncharacterized protein n=1 Tax=Dimargaris verticillata TaxID=2761393 RepID=A0A9W8B1G6_9FUNG|nr:hypothetical protein H4R34_003791 [Dimargaris verticillata]
MSVRSINLPELITFDKDERDLSLAVPDHILYTINSAKLSTMARESDSLSMGHGRPTDAIKPLTVGQRTSQDMSAASECTSATAHQPKPSFQTTRTVDSHGPYGTDAPTQPFPCHSTSGDSASQSKLPHLPEGANELLRNDAKLEPSDDPGNAAMIDDDEDEKAGAKNRGPRAWMRNLFGCCLPQLK